MRATGHLIAVELRLFLREPVAVFFSLVFPFIPLLVIGSLFGRGPAMPGFRVIDVYVPALIAMVIAYLGLMSIPIALSQYREQGVLKRYRASPLSLTSVLVAHIAVQFSVLAVVSALMVLVAELAFGLRYAGHPALIVMTVAVGCASMFTLGFALVGAFSSPRATQAVGSVLFFVMLFTSGAAIPRRQFPPWLKDVTDYVPLSHLVDALTAAWVGESLSPHYDSLLLLLAIGVAAFFFACLTFTWSPE